MKKADKKQESEIVPVTEESPMAPIEEKGTEPEKIEAQEPVKEEKEFIEEKKDGKPKQTIGQIVRLRVAAWTAPYGAHPWARPNWVVSGRAPRRQPQGCGARPGARAAAQPELGGE